MTLISSSISKPDREALYVTGKQVSPAKEARAEGREAGAHKSDCPPPCDLNSRPRCSLPFLGTLHLHALSQSNGRGHLGREFRSHGGGQSRLCDPASLPSALASFAGLTCFPVTYNASRSGLEIDELINVICSRIRARETSENNPSMY